MDSDEEDFQSADEDLTDYEDFNATCQNNQKNDSREKKKETSGAKTDRNINENISKESTPKQNINVCSKETSISKLGRDTEIQAPAKEEPMIVNDEDKCESKSGKETPTESSLWGGWGVSSFLQAATQGVVSIKKNVASGINTVVDSMNVPDPEELAREHSKKTVPKDADIPDETEEKSSFKLGSFLTGVTHLTKLVENTGTKVLSSGLDTLEVIGKKTMEVLQEGDPGLRNKMSLLKIDQNKVVLSELLHEAKENAARENEILQQQQKVRVKKPANYETLFDNFHGLVHLEALELLSKQCRIKLETLSERKSGAALTDFQETLSQVEELCELPEGEDDDDISDWSTATERLKERAQDLNVDISFSDLSAVLSEADTYAGCDDYSAEELHDKAIETLAHITAIATKQFRRAGELLLVKEHRSTADEADALVQLTSTLSLTVDRVAGKFTERLNSIENHDGHESISYPITNIFLEATNSSTYLKQALCLLLPVLQIGAV